MMRLSAFITIVYLRRWQIQADAFCSAFALNWFLRLIGHIVHRDLVMGCLLAVIRTMLPGLVAHMAS